MPEGKYAFAFPTTADDPFRLFWGLYYQKEGAPVITKDLEISFEKDKAVAVLEYMKKFYDAGLIPANLEDYIKFFTAGNAAICIGGVWNTYTMENQDVVDFGVTLIPQLFDKLAIWGDSHTLIMPTKETSEEKKEACMKFFDFVSKNSITWATAGHVVANVNVVASPEFAALPNRSDYAGAADYVVFFEPTPYNYPIRDAMIAQIGAYLSGNQSAEEAYDAIILEIEDIIG